MVKKFKLSKKTKLCKNKSFQKVYRFGKSYANRLLALYVLPNKAKNRKVGFAAGKRLGCAVVRNRVKRLLREVYRFNQNKIKIGVDLVIIGRQAAIKSDIDTITGSFLDLCSKAGILTENQ